MCAISILRSYVLSIGNFAENLLCESRCEYEQDKD